MSYTLLQLVDQVSGELGLAQPSIVIGSNNNQTVQLLALAQRLGKDLSRDFEWEYLVKAKIMQTTAAVSTTGTTVSAATTITSIPSTASLSVGMVISGTGIPAYAEIVSIDSSTQVTMTVPATASGSAVALTFAYQDYALPADFDRMVPDSNWDRTNHWRNLGPKCSQEWQFLQGGLISTGPRERYRLYQGKLRIFPALTTVYNFAFEYVSNYWVVATGGTAATKSAFTADTDTTVYPDNLLAAGLKYYFLKAKKLDYGIELAEYEDALSKAKAQDQPIGKQSLAPLVVEQFVGPWSIQDGNWPTS